jgi:hypothetical protein
MLISLYNLDKIPNPFIKQKYVSYTTSNSEEVSLKCWLGTVGTPQKDWGVGVDHENGQE